MAIDFLIAVLYLILFLVHDHVARCQTNQRARQDINIEFFVCTKRATTRDITSSSVTIRRSVRRDGQASKLSVI
jgi:hypothetical protein